MISPQNFRRDVPIKKLEDVVVFKDNLRKPITSNERIDGPYPYYGANGIQGYINDFIFDEELVLLAEDGGHFYEPDRGIAYKVNGKTWVNNHAHVLSPKSNIDINYLWRVLENLDIKEYVNGTTRAKLTKSNALQIKIPLPPLAEQKRIAAILDKANEIKAKRELALAKLDELSKSIFKEIKSLSKNTKKIKLKDVTIKITDGTHHSPQITETGVPYITAKHLKFYGLDFYSKPWFISKEDHELIYKRCDPKKRDVLYIKDGATTGIAAINNYDFEFSMLSSLALIRVDEAFLNPYYLKFWLNDVDVKNQLLGSMAGAAIQRFTLSKIKDFEIPLVNIDIQNKFELQMKEIEKNISLNSLSLTNITNCIFSLQNQAFTTGFNA